MRTVGTASESTYAVRAQSRDQQTERGARAIHHWPGRIGQPIDPKASADSQMRDDSFWGMTFAEVYAVRENLVRERGLPAPFFVW